MEIALKVEGMMCDGCAESVTNALTGTGKVEEAGPSIHAQHISALNFVRPPLAHFSTRVLFMDDDVKDDDDDDDNKTEKGKGASS